LKLKDISNLRTGLVTARKKASAVDKEAFDYRAVTLKSFNRNGCLSVKHLDNFTSKEKINNTDLLIPSLVATIRVDSDDVDSKFLTYYLNSQVVKRALNSSITGTAINMIKTKELEDLEIKLPSLEEQKKIVEFLDLTNKEIDLLRSLKTEKEKYYAENEQNKSRNNQWYSMESM